MVCLRKQSQRQRNKLWLNIPQRSLCLKMQMKITSTQTIRTWVLTYRKVTTGKGERMYQGDSVWQLFAIWYLLFAVIVGSLILIN